MTLRNVELMGLLGRELTRIFSDHLLFDLVFKDEEAYTVGDSIEEALSKSGDPVVKLHRQQIALAKGFSVVHPN